MRLAEFNYSFTIRIVLIATAFGFEFLMCYFINNTVLKLYDQKLRLGQKLVFVFIASAYIFSTFLVFYLFNGAHDLEAAQNIAVTVANPSLLIIGYFYRVRVWGFSSYKTIRISRQTYILMLIYSVITQIIRQRFLEQFAYYSYFYDILCQLSLSIICWGLYKLSIYLLDRFMFIISITDGAPMKNRRAGFLLALIQSIILYLLTLYLLTAFSGRLPGEILLLACLGLYLCVDVAFVMKEMLKNELDNRTVYIGSLIKSIGNFQNLKQNFRTILESYGEYMDRGDMRALKAYHESLLGKTILTADKLNLTRRMAQNPALVALLLKKLDFAEQQGVAMSIPGLCPLNQMYIQDFDLCRVLGNLLDNAIEAAAASPKRKLQISFEQKSCDSKLIIISNTTGADVDIDRIAVHGTSTKQGHMGVGLSQVRGILRKYGNTTLRLTYFQSVFTVYINLWALNSLGEAGEQQ